MTVGCYYDHNFADVMIRMKKEMKIGGYYHRERIEQKGQCRKDLKWVCNFVEAPS